MLSVGRGLSKLVWRGIEPVS